MLNGGGVFEKGIAFGNPIQNNRNPIQKALGKSQKTKGTTLAKKERVLPAKNKGYYLSGFSLLSQSATGGGGSGVHSHLRPQVSWFILT